MSWSAALHPRDPYGKFRRTNLEAGWHEATTRTGKTVKYYINQQGALSTGMTALAMTAKGRVYSGINGRPAGWRTGEDGLKHYHEAQAPSTAEETIHITGTADGEQMMIAASDSMVMGVVNHDQMASENEFRVNRGAQFQPTSQNLAENETGVGGRPALESNRKEEAKGKRYNTLNAQRAQNMNEEVFNNPHYKEHIISPDELGDKVAEARKEWERRNPHLAPHEARIASMYVDFDRQGNLRVYPVEDWKTNSKGDLVKTTLPMKQRAVGDNAMIMSADDLTRMSRGLAAEGIQSMRVRIAPTVKVSHETGQVATERDIKKLNKRDQPAETARRNALYFQKDTVNPRSHDRITMWGNMQSRNAAWTVDETRNHRMENLVKNGQITPAMAANYANYEQSRFEAQFDKRYKNPTTREQVANYWNNVHRFRGHEKGNIDVNRIQFTKDIKNAPQGAYPKGSYRFIGATSTNPDGSQTVHAAIYSADNIRLGDEYYTRSKDGVTTRRLEKQPRAVVQASRAMLRNTALQAQAVNNPYPAGRALTASYDRKAREMEEIRREDAAYQRA